MNSEVKNILILISATIFADKRVYASEVDTFIQSAKSLGVLKRLAPSLSEAKLLNWYEMNKDYVRDNLSTPYFKDWFYKLLDALSEVPEKEFIVEAMKKISQADGEIHVSERALIVLAERHWGLR